MSSSLHHLLHQVSWEIQFGLVALRWWWPLMGLFTAWQAAQGRAGEFSGLGHASAVVWPWLVAVWAVVFGASIATRHRMRAVDAFVSTRPISPSVFWAAQAIWLLVGSVAVLGSIVAIRLGILGYGQGIWLTLTCMTGPWLQLASAAWVITSLANAGPSSKALMVCWPAVIVIVGSFFFEPQGLNDWLSRCSRMQAFWLLWLWIVGSVAAAWLVLCQNGRLSTPSLKLCTVPVGFVFTALWAALISWNGFGGSRENPLALTIRHESWNGVSSVIEVPPTEAANRLILHSDSLYTFPHDGGTRERSTNPEDSGIMIPDGVIPPDQLAFSYAAKPWPVGHQSSFVTTNGTRGVFRSESSRSMSLAAIDGPEPWSYIRWHQSANKHDLGHANAEEPELRVRNEAIQRIIGGKAGQVLRPSRYRPELPFRSENLWAQFDPVQAQLAKGSKVAQTLPAKLEVMTGSMVEIGRRPLNDLQPLQLRLSRLNLSRGMRYTDGSIELQLTLDKVTSPWDSSTLFTSSIDCLGWRWVLQHRESGVWSVSSPISLVSKDAARSRANRSTNGDGTAWITSATHTLRLGLPALSDSETQAGDLREWDLIILRPSIERLYRIPAEIQVNWSF